MCLKEWVPSVNIRFLTFAFVLMIARDESKEKKTENDGWRIGHLIHFRRHADVPIQAIGRERKYVSCIATILLIYCVMFYICVRVCAHVRMLRKVRPPAPPC